MLPVADSPNGTVDLVLAPVRRAAFDTAEDWMRDVTADVPRELRFVERAGA